MPIVDLEVIFLKAAWLYLIETTNQAKWALKTLIDGRVFESLLLAFLNSGSEPALA